MINYTERGHWLHDAIRKAGYSLREENGVWRSNNDAAVQAIIDSFDPLPYIKAEKVSAIKAEGLARIQAVFPAINGFDELQLVREMFLSIAPAARQPTANWQRMIDIYAAGKSAIDAINAATTTAGVEAVSPNWPI